MGVVDAAVAAMLRTARPVSRGTVQVWIDTPDEAHTVSGEVLHVSTSDLLVGSDHRLPVASRGRFALRLEHVPVEVRGECEVVHDVRPTRGGAAGFALRMLQFEDDGTVDSSLPLSSAPDRQTACRSARRHSDARPAIRQNLDELIVRVPRPGEQLAGAIAGQGR